MAELPKRLTPTSGTLRELYLKSGNACAFPGCPARIIDQNGVFIAEVCHIEAAEPGGERFNPAQTNEQRRSFDNLILLCHQHHKVTDDIRTYTVERLKQMKASHEAKFTDVVSLIRASIVDHTATASIAQAVNLSRMNDVLDWNATPDELVETAKELGGFAERLRRLPPRTKELVAIVVERGSAGGYLASDWRAQLDDVVEATGEHEAEIIKHVRILQTHLVGDGINEDGDSLIELGRLRSGWNVWSDIKTFCARTGTPVREILVDLRFDLLD